MAENTRITKEAKARATARRQAQAWAAPSGGNGFRLPDKTVFAATYDATAQRWHGTLTVPGVDGELRHAQGSIHGLIVSFGRMAHKAGVTTTDRSCIRPQEDRRE